MASRPWRDGQDVLQLSLRHLAEVFVVTPSGALLAPNAIELRLSPRDYESLGERMDYGLVASSAAEVYAEQVAAHGAHFASYGPAEVHVLSDPAVPEGRYQLRQARPLGVAAPPAPGPRAFQVPPSTAEPRAFQVPPSTAEPRAFQVPPSTAEPRAFQVPQPVPAAKPGWPFSHDGATSAEPVTATAAPPGPPTVTEAARPAIPLLRLATGDDVVETQVSGARAGRGAGVELLLPDVPTVSREHARFTYSDGQWWIANLGLNGLTLNEIALAGEHPLRDGDIDPLGQESGRAGVPGQDRLTGPPPGRARLSVWVAARKEWVSCPPDEITWLDRSLLSGNSDLTLHRAPRCAGLRHVHHRWEVFSRDPTYQVYLARYSGGPPLDARGVQAAARAGAAGRPGPALRDPAAGPGARCLAGQRRELGAAAAAGRPARAVR